jgi:COP9 signalosome complex subunit 6
MDIKSMNDNLMAPSSVSPSVIIALHPLVILNVADHWTRVRAQSGHEVQIYGALLGRIKGRNMELCTSFEIKMTSKYGNLEEIDLEFLNISISQCK